MKIFSPEVAEGSSIKNASIAYGTSFPAQANIGELFYLTTGSVGLYVHDGSTWINYSQVATGVTAGEYTKVTTDIYGRITAGSNPTTLSALGITETYLPLSGGTLTGNLNFSGARKITGDFSNATIANRCMLQTSSTNASTSVGIIPNGTSVAAGILAFNASDPTNASFISINVGASVANITSFATGTGSPLPLVLNTSGSEKLRIGADTTGTFTFSGTAPRITGDFSNATHANRAAFQTSVTDGVTSVPIIPNGAGQTSALTCFNSSTVSNCSYGQFRCSNTATTITSGYVGTSTFLPITFETSGTERMRVAADGTISCSGQALAKNGALTDEANISWDGNTNGQVVNVTLGGNRIMNAPSNIQQYAMYILRISQDATGSRTLSWNAAFKFGSAGAPTLSTGANKVDFISFIGGSSNTLECIGYRLDAV